jgi:acetylornithine deacetylase/succinyl-diaminopimelate desuccinylase-like protein
MPPDSSEPSQSEAATLLGDPAGLRLLASLVSIAPTNLEDPIHHRWEKPNYIRAADQIVRTAREFGLATRIFDPLMEGDPSGELHGIPRPNVVIDLDRGAPETILILAHYDVVPVPAEQLSRWKSPPHTLTFRSDGRLYGRGVNDDLGSGIVSSLLAMRRLAEAEGLTRNVRLLACCDEETGGEGGIESLRTHDEGLPADSPERFIRGEVALIPDGSPRATAGSSGIVFLDAGFDQPVPLHDVLSYGQFLVNLHEMARTWRSIYASPDWPDYQAPEPVITGRATLTRFDVQTGVLESARPRLVRAHAETEATNQIPESVTFLFDGPAPVLAALAGQLEEIVPSPFRLSPPRSSALQIPETGWAIQLVGRSAHGGYPHLAHNPTPEALRLLGGAISRQWIDPSVLATATFSVDLRLIPEMPIDSALTQVLSRAREWSQTHSLHATIDAPQGRRRGGYALPIDHPAVIKLERMLRARFGSAGVTGEYGGTDASALQGLRTPSGQPLPALVFGSMDRTSNIHGAEENADPRFIRKVTDILCEYALSP